MRWYLQVCLFERGESILSLDKSGGCMGCCCVRVRGSRSVLRMFFSSLFLLNGLREWRGVDVRSMENG